MVRALAPLYERYLNDHIILTIKEALDGSAASE